MSPKSNSTSKNSTVRSPNGAEGRRFGWIPDLPDQRDHLFSVSAAVASTLPPRVDLRHRCAPVVDQGSLGSCTANALANAHLFCQINQPGGVDALPSRLFLYYNERALRATVKSDSGAQIRDGIKVLAKLGDAPETLWPYDIAKFTVKPHAKVYKEARKHLVVGYQRVAQSLPQLKGALATGFPVAFGFSVYESFQSEIVAKTGVAPLPAASERVLGGHAVLAVGYDDSKQVFRVQNSWGVGWGQKGFFTLPYAYLASKELSADFWTIRLVEE